MAIETIPPIIADAPHLQVLHTLEITFEDGTVSRWAGQSVTIAGAAYSGELVRVNSFRRSLGGAIDRIDVEIGNLDYIHSLRILNDRSRRLSRAIVGQLFRDYLNDGEWIWQLLFRGVVGQPYTSETTATYSILSDLSAAPQVGATAIVMRNCRWRYKDGHCNSPSPEPTCDKTFHLSTGCAGRGPTIDTVGGNQFRFGGVNYDISKATLFYPPPADPNGGSGDNGGGVNPKDPSPGSPYPDMPY